MDTWFNVLYISGFWGIRKMDMLGGKRFFFFLVAGGQGETVPMGWIKGSSVDRIWWGTL